MVLAGHHFYLVTLYIGNFIDYLTPKNKKIPTFQTINVEKLEIYVIASVIGLLSSSAQCLGFSEHQVLDPL